MGQKTAWYMPGCEQRGQSPGPRGAEMSSVRMDPGRGSRSPLSLPTLSRQQPRGPRSWPSGLHWAPSRPQEPSLTGKTQKGGPARSMAGEALLRGLQSRDEQIPAGKAPRQQLPPGHVHPHLGTCPASPLARANSRQEPQDVPGRRPDFRPASSGPCSKTRGEGQAIQQPFDGAVVGHLGRFGLLRLEPDLTYSKRVWVSSPEIR